MKTLILILTTGFILIGCNKEDNSSEGIPATYDLYFELLRSDGSIYGDDELQISGAQELVDGQLRAIGNGELSWFNLGKLSEQSQNGGSSYFGISCIANCENYLPLQFASGDEGEEIEENETWEKDKYWVFSYPNNDLDTLRINHIVTRNPNTIVFKFFINEEEFSVTEGDFDQYYMAIQK